MLIRRNQPIVRQNTQLNGLSYKPEQTKEIKLILPPRTINKHKTPLLIILH